MAKSRNRKKRNTTKNNNTKQRQPIVINLKAFWRGSVMSDINLSEVNYNQLMRKIREPFLDDDQVDGVVNSLDNMENDYYHQQQASPTNQYEVGTMREQVSTILCISDLIRRGVIENDDNYGIISFKIFN